VHAALGWLAVEACAIVQHMVNLVRSWNTLQPSIITLLQFDHAALCVCCTYVCKCLTMLIGTTNASAAAAAAASRASALDSKQPRKHSTASSGSGYTNGRFINGRCGSGDLTPVAADVATPPAAVAAAAASGKRRRDNRDSRRYTL
jgi:hypothetical protein